MKNSLQIPPLLSQKNEVKKERQVWKLSSKQASHHVNGDQWLGKKELIPIYLQVLCPSHAEG